MRIAFPARAVLAIALVSWSCAGSALKDRTHSVDALITEARDNGAVRCAPVELAMAESHNEFAKTELRQGHFYPGKAELEVAEENAKAAVAKSPRKRCNPLAPAPVKGPGDLDGDGILDDKDECPKVPEDKDGFQDEDGCPDLDNDNDGIADANDKCPNEPETINGIQDDDGCPDRGDALVAVTPSALEATEAVQFTGTKIAKGSTNLLGQVAATLRAHQEIVRLKIVAHVQPSGDTDRDQDLSEKRAQAVRDWLIAWGIPQTRLSAQGLGGQKPLVPRGAKNAQMINDRIEMIILERK